MKQKISSLILVLALTLSLSVPAFAAPAGCPAAQAAAQTTQCGEMPFHWSDWLRALLAQLYGQQSGGSDGDGGESAPSQGEEPDAPPQGEAESAERAYEREVIRLVNVERSRAGLRPLSEDELLTRTARMKSQDMHDRRYFDHNSPTYGSPFQLMRSQGVRYRTAGENIAMGYRSAAAVVAAWMNSPGHRANILNASYTRIGVGYVADGHYCTQHFTG